MLPADQGFYADGLAAAHVDLGLVVEDEFVCAERAPDVLQALVVTAQVAVLFGVEDVEAVLAEQLGVVHRLVGLAQELVGVGLLGLRVEGETEAGRHLQQVVADAYRLCGRFEQAIEHRYAGRDIVEILQHGDEFVAAETRQRVALTQRLLHARGDGDQQLVAGLVPVPVIDGLEAVEVEVGDGQRIAAAQGLRHRLAHAVGEQDAIGQRRQCVVVGDVFELALVFLERRDVGEERHVLRDLAAAVTHRADRLHDRVHLAALPPVPDFTVPVALVGQVVPQAGVERLLLATGAEDARRLPDDLFARVAGNTREGVVDLDDRAIGGGDHDPFARMGEHAGGELQLLLGFLQFGDGARLLDVLEGAGRQLVGHRKQRPRDLVEALARHRGDLLEGLGDLLLVGADLARVGAYALLALRLVAHLADQPVGDMPAADGNAGAGIPQAPAHALLHDRPFRVIAADHRVRVQAVGAAFFRLADQAAAQVRGVGRHGKRRTVRIGDVRRDADGIREVVLDTLQLLALEQVLQGDRCAVERLRQRDDALLDQFFGVLAFRNVGNDADDTALRAVGIDDAPAGEVAPELVFVGTAIDALHPEFRIGQSELLLHVALRAGALGRMDEATVLGAGELVERPCEHLGHALVGLHDVAAAVEQEDGDARCVEDLLEQRLPALQDGVGFGQFTRALGNLGLERLVEFGQHLGGLHLAQAIEADLGKDAGQLRKEERRRLDVLGASPWNPIDCVEIGGFVVTEGPCLPAEKVQIGRFGQYLSGEYTRQMLALDDDRRGGVDQPVRAAEDDKRGLAVRAVEQGCVARRAAPARSRVRAMVVRAGVFPAGIGQARTVDIDDRVGNADRRAETIHQRLQLRDVDELGKSVPGFAHDCCFPSRVGAQANRLDSLPVDITPMR